MCSALINPDLDVIARLGRAIQYAETSRLKLRSLEYWIARIRGQ